MATKNKDYLYDKAALINEYEDYLRDNGLEANVESFSSFLKASKLPTTHAAEIFTYLTTKDGNLQVGDMQIRKRHPVWDYIRKKVLYPAGITGSMIGVTTGAIAASGLISGANFMGFLPVFSNPALTFGATAAIGAGLGAAGTVAFIAAKDFTVRQYYKLRYKDAASNLQQLQDGLDLKNVSMIQLMEKIEATSQEIFTLGKHSIKRAILNKINRNRIHQLEDIIVDLYPMWTKLDGLIARAKKANDKTAIEHFLKQKEFVETLLLQADKFVSKNLSEAKLNALMTCKEKRKHSHSTVENVDIYATIANKLDAVRRHTADKDIKKMPKNTTLKKQTAEKLVNGTRRLIPELIERTATKGLVGEDEPFIDLTPPKKAPTKRKPTPKSKPVEPTPTTPVEPKKPVTPKKPVATTKTTEPKKSAEPKTTTKPAPIRTRETETAAVRRKRAEELKTREFADPVVPAKPVEEAKEPKVNTPNKPKSGDDKKPTAKKPAAKTPVKETAKKPAAKETVKEPAKETEPKKQSKVSDEKVLIATAVLEKLNDSTFVSTQLNGATALQYITAKNTPKTFMIDQADIDGLKAKLKEWLKSPEAAQLRLYGKQDDLFKYIKFRTIRNMRTTVQSL